MCTALQDARAVSPVPGRKQATKAVAHAQRALSKETACAEKERIKQDSKKKACKKKVSKKRACTKKVSKRKACMKAPAVVRPAGALATVCAGKRGPTEGAFRIVAAALKTYIQQCQGSKWVHIVMVYGSFGGRTELDHGALCKTMLAELCTGALRPVKALVLARRQQLVDSC